MNVDFSIGPFHDWDNHERKPMDFGVARPHDLELVALEVNSMWASAGCISTDSRASESSTMEWTLVNHLGDSTFHWENHWWVIIWPVVNHQWFQYNGMNLGEWVNGMVLTGENGDELLVKITLVILGKWITSEWWWRWWRYVKITFFWMVIYQGENWLTITIGSHSNHLKLHWTLESPKIVI